MPRGRPTKYKDDFPKAALKLAEKGWTDAEIASFFEVSEVTINAWKEKHPEFLKSLNDGKDTADAEVERSLYERACGYSHPAVKIFCTKDGDTIEHGYTEHYPPDPTSMIFWLKNRQPEKWRDKQEHELTGKNGAPITAVINFGTKPPEK